MFGSAEKEDSEVISTDKGFIKLSNFINISAIPRTCILVTKNDNDSDFKDCPTP